jgi:hypothetical protein
MNDKTSPAAVTSGSPFPVVIAGIVAIAIFITDTLAPLDIAVAVLYVVVVLLAANYFVADESLARCLVSVSAIGATTFPALQSNSASMTLRGQARLLDLTRDTIFVRNMSDVVTYPGPRARIWVSSNAGGVAGTTFQFTVPVAKSSGPTTRVP